MPEAPRLVVLPSLPVARASDKLILTRKFLSGIGEYQSRWPGPVQVVMEPAAAATDSLDNVALRREDLPFDLVVTQFRSSEIEGILQGAAMALASTDHHQVHLADLCRRLGVPCVYGTEYSLRTRLQIVRTGTTNPLRLARRCQWEIGQERRIRRALRVATGVQCNGTPTYEAYRSINPRAMLFFDTRVPASLLADEATLRRRFEARRAGGTLRLAFSGRLIAMKGADHLIRVAAALRGRGRPFEFAICGAGTLEPQMRQEVERRGLGGVVRFRGNLDFKSELMPFVRDHVDLFVCCHRQGDPSCTYLETMACGVPIVGYDNEAFHGVVDQSGAGWTSPMNRPGLLADRIAALGDEELEHHARRSLAFARKRTFDKEFGRRIEHLRELAGLGQLSKAA